MKAKKGKKSNEWTKRWKIYRNRGKRGKMRQKNAERRDKRINEEDLM